MFPGKYQSDFAVQVTSHVPGAQQYAVSFANNNLMGRGNVLPEYRTSKARVCVTVGMMTTGYDCPDLLNLGLFRPIFSPTEFIQIKGRGTRKHDFLDLIHDERLKEDISEAQKTAYKLFDFFANCEYFETRVRLRREAGTAASARAVERRLRRRRHRRGVIHLLRRVHASRRGRTSIHTSRADRIRRDAD